MIYFLVNKFGGSGRAYKTWKKIEKTLSNTHVKYEVLFSHGEGSLKEIAKEVSSKNEKNIRIVVVGGDGTINEVVNGLQNLENVRFAVIPTGSGNDFCRGLKINKGPACIKKNLRKILRGKVSHTIDVGVIKNSETSRRFVISSGFGMDAIVCKKALTSKIKKFLNKIGLGKLTYVVLTVISIFTMKRENVYVKFDNEDKKLFKKIIFISSMNTKYEGGGVPMAPQAKPDDGELSLCMCQGIPKFFAFLFLPLLVGGLAKFIPGFTVKNFKTMEIECESNVTVHTDGEWAGDLNNLKVELLSEKLKVLN